MSTPVRQCRKNLNNVPFGGEFIAKHPETGSLIKSRTWEGLVAACKTYQQANNFPIGIFFESQVEDWLCVAMPFECGPCIGNQILRPSRLSVSDVIHGTEVMLAFKLSGNATVPRSEAKRRADLCNDCPVKTVLASGCSGMCGPLKALVEKIVPSKENFFSNDAIACSVCHCFLNAAVWLPLETQCHGVTAEMRSMFESLGDRCWKKC